MESSEKLYNMLNNEQKSFLATITYVENDMADLEEQLGDYMQTEGLDIDYKTTEQGEICLSILDFMSKI